MNACVHAGYGRRTIMLCAPKQSFGGAVVTYDFHLARFHRMYRYVAGRMGRSNFTRLLSIGAVSRMNVEICSRQAVIYLCILLGYVHTVTFVGKAFPKKGIT
jgi:hypothetical protein